MRRSAIFLGAREDVAIRVAIRVLGILVFSFATSLGALVKIPLPFTPVPITLQTYFVLLSGLTLGASSGAISQFTYLILGIMGLPMFAGGSAGVKYLFGSTGGYLVGFITASFIAGFAARDGVSRLAQWFYLIASTVVIWTMGVVVLSLYTGEPLSISVARGVVPFIPGDILKIVAVLGSWQCLKKFRRYLIEKHPSLGGRL